LLICLQERENIFGHKVSKEIDELLKTVTNAEVSQGK
jgi:hypothetical protein